MEEERKKKAFVTLDYALCTIVVPFNDVMQLFNNNGQLGVKRNSRLLSDSCLVIEIKTLMWRLRFTYSHVYFKKKRSKLS